MYSLSSSFAARKSVPAFSFTPVEFLIFEKSLEEHSQSNLRVRVLALIFHSSTWYGRRKEANLEMLSVGGPEIRCKTSTKTPRVHISRSSCLFYFPSLPSLFRFRFGHRCFILSFSCGYYAVSSVLVSAATRLAYALIYTLYICCLLYTSPSPRD